MTMPIKLKGVRSHRFLRGVFVAVTLCLLTISAIGAQSIAGAESVQCNNALATQAEAAIDSVNSWHDLFNHFRKYGNCDDGALAEAYSDRVASMLVMRWSDIGTLNRLVRQSPIFRAFVLRHVNSLMSPEQAAIILESAKSRCPNVAKLLCADLIFNINDST